MMNIEAGKYYIRRDGELAGPAREDVRNPSYPYIVGNNSYTPNGKFTLSELPHPYDLVNEIFITIRVE